MKVWQILRTLEKLESSMSNYYDRLARFHRQDPEAASERRS
jgi:hypothetical protein